MILRDLITNPMLVSTIVAWWLAQFIKVPIWYFVTRKWKWELMFGPGGMPSSHAALISATMLSVGFHEGFDTASFAIATAIALIVLYDATGVRRQAGYHAQKINVLIEELLKGHPISQETLKEVIGHTPRQVFVGSLFGFLIAWIISSFW